MGVSRRVADVAEACHCGISVDDVEGKDKFGRT